MTCREFADFMADYLSGELADETRQAFEHHLHLCVNCRKYLDGYKAAIKLGKGVFARPDGPMPEDVPEQLVQAILATRPRRT